MWSAHRVLGRDACGLVGWVVGCVMGWAVDRAYDKVVGVGVLGSVVCPRNVQGIKNERALTSLSNLS